MHILKLLLGWLLLALLPAGSILAADPSSLLPPEEAFIPNARLIDGTHINLQWQVADGYYLYRERIHASHGEEKLELRFPAGKIKDDPNFGKTEVYAHDLAVQAQSPRALQPSDEITVSFQGCAEAGVCYPPQKVTLRLDGSSPAGDRLGTLFGPRSDRTGATDPDFTGDTLWLTLGLFFLGGLGLSLTACLYPLIPIASAIILGQQGISRQRSLLLTFSYIQGMALSYTLAGLLAAASGTLLVVALQQPWVIALFAGFFVIMAFAMFGAFELQLPSGLQSRIQLISQKLPGGHIAPVFVMGALSALLVGPCMAPPLAAALAYIGQTGDLLFGGLSLYALALGMGAPLLLIGAFGASILPRLSGQIMVWVRRGFGIILLGVAVWVAQPLWLRYLPGHAVNQSAAGQFTLVQSETELDQALLAARGTPVLVDFYADWCISCIELERNTFPAPEVKQALQGYTLIRADVTANDAASHALLQRFGLYGPPALLFYDATGTLQNERIIGFLKPAEFVAALPARTTQP